MILRTYQTEMVAAIRAAWAAGQRRVLGSLPTGGGKTEVAIDILRDEATPTSRVLVLVERKVIAGLWADRLQRHGITDVGVLQGSNTRKLYSSTIVATAQTIRTRGVPADVGLIVIDECHIWHKAHDQVLASASGARVLGLTATPLREGLGTRFDKMIVGSTIRELIRLGHLVQPRYFAPRHEAVEAALALVPVRAGDFATDALSAAMRTKSIIGDVVGGWKRRGEDRQTIAFCVDKAHAAELAGEFQAAGVVAEVIVDDTDDDDRARILGAFDRLEVRVLCSVGVLAVGFDSPVASCAIMARPTLSLSLFVQQGGRVLRPFPGKADALVLDHAANTLRHGKLEDFAPPTELSQINRTSDKKSRRAATDGWVCKHCAAINDRADDTCTECGHPRRRQTAVVVLDGELVQVDVTAGAALPGPTVVEVQLFYRMCLWFGRTKGFKKPEAWAYYAMQRRFRFDADAARRLGTWGWRDLAVIPPDDDASRWFRADFQRSRVAARYAQQAGL